jgi:hypothetical protein
MKWLVLWRPQAGTNLNCLLNEAAARQILHIPLSPMIIPLRALAGVRQLEELSYAKSTAKKVRFTVPGTC